MIHGGRALAILLGAAIGAASASRPAGDPDVYWHLATAREALAHGIVRGDLFSWTIRGAPVSTDQWMGQLLLYGAYLIDGEDEIPGDAAHFADSVHFTDAGCRAMAQRVAGRLEGAPGFQALFAR